MKQMIPICNFSPKKRRYSNSMEKSFYPTFNLLGFWTWLSLVLTDTGIFVEVLDPAIIGTIVLP